VRVLVEGTLDRAIVLFGTGTDPGPELTWARGITLLASDGDDAAPNRAGPIAVVGWSTTGLDAFAFAARHAKLVDRLALVATPIPADEDTLGFALSDVTAKTLLLFGARDPMTGSRHGTWWQRQLPNARLEMDPDGGHDLLVPKWKRVLSHLAPRCKR
jgi:pimeloyl-ACP methyl ester carboxylesterase